MKKHPLVHNPSGCYFKHDSSFLKQSLILAVGKFSIFPNVTNKFQVLTIRFEHIDIYTDLLKTILFKYLLGCNVVCCLCPF